MPGVHWIHDFTPAPGRGAALAEALGAVPRLGLWTIEWGQAGSVVMLTEAGALTDADPALPWHDLHRRDATLLRPCRAVAMPAEPAAVWALRRYRCQAGQGARFADLLLGALAVRERYSRCAGLWQAASGCLDEVVHLWPFADHGERDRIRAAAAADPDWQAFRVEAIPLLAEVAQSMLRPLAVPGGP